MIDLDLNHVELGDNRLTDEEKKHFLVEGLSAERTQQSSPLRFNEPSQDPNVPSWKSSNK